MFDKEVLGILQRKSEVYKFIRDLWLNNFDGVGFKNLAQRIFEEVLRKKSFAELKIQIEDILNDKRFKKQSRNSRKKGNLNSFQLDILTDYLKEAESLLDFGCGKMSLLRQISKGDFSNIKTLAGYDPKSNPSYIDFDPRARFFDKLCDLKDQKFDLVTSTFVMHHLTQVEIQQSFEVIKSCLNPGGKFILIEESFGENMPNRDSINYLAKLGYEINLDLTGRFMEMSREDQMQILFINDVLINYKNLDYIPWTKKYKTISEWKNLAEKSSFIFDKSYFFGFIKKGRLKQGITSMLVFTHSL